MSVVLIEQWLRSQWNTINVWDTLVPLYWEWKSGISLGNSFWINVIFNALRFTFILEDSFPMNFNFKVFRPVKLM